MEWLRSVRSASSIEVSPAERAPLSCGRDCYPFSISSRHPFIALSDRKYQKNRVQSTTIFPLISTRLYTSVSLLKLWFAHCRTGLVESPIKDEPFTSRGRDLK